MNTINWDRLEEDYIVITLKGKALSEYDDLRELDQDFGNGVAGLWSDAAQSLVAFAFNSVTWNEEDAQAWVKQAQTEDVQTQSFDEIRRQVEKAIVRRYVSNVDDPQVGEPWITEMGTDTVVYFHDGQHYAVTYSIVGEKVLLGEPRQVRRSWQDKDGGQTVMLYALDSVLADGTQAEDEDADLVWKEIIKPGTWFKMDSGRKIEVTANIIKEAFRAFQDGLPKFVSVPADSHHSPTRGVVPAEHNRGFLPRLKLLGDSLFGGFKLTDPQVSAGVQDGSIADCSVYLQPDVVHPQTGQKYPWVLRHVLLTNNPLVQDLRPFGDIPADANEGDVRIIHYRQHGMPESDGQEVMMPEDKQATDVLTGADEIVLTGEAAREYSELAALGLTAEDIRTLAEAKQHIEAQAEAMREKARALEITAVVKALEGQGEHAGVSQVAGYRHFPVVVAAVEKALREAPAALALDADEEGVSPVDAAILEIVNAIPETGRIALDGEDQEPPKQTRTPQAAKVTDEKVDELLERIGA